MGNYEEVLKTIIELLEHVKNVEDDIQNQTKNRTIELSKFLDKNSITPSVEVLEGIQYQDILSQQLSATSDAMNHICKNLERYLVAIDSDSIVLKDSIDSLANKLKLSISQAKDKQEAFSGRVHKENDDSEDEIEFF